MMDREKIKGLTKKYKLQIICVAGGVVLFVLAQILQPGKAESIHEIERAGYGNKKTESLYVDGLEDDTVQMNISVQPRKYSDDEIDDAMRKCMESAVEEALGDNPSTSEIYYDMKLPDRSSEYGFKLVWTSDDRDVITSAGTVKNAELKEARETILHVAVSNEDHKNEYAVPVTVMPQKLTDSERRARGLTEMIEDADEKAATAPKVELPENYEGRSIRYTDSKDRSYNFIWIFGIVLALLFFLRDRENEKTEQKKRDKQMQMDYPEIVSGLLIFVGAGMSVRTAWNTIADDYENKRKADDKFEIRYAYEELCRANNRLKTGTPEGAVYRDFGRQCRLKQYMKLASLLEQNRRSGVANMKSLLQLEMMEAWEERRNLALRQGEEASTKLLIPLIMMLVIVMVIIMTPAIMGFI